jgi:hypothetical protein
MIKLANKVLWGATLLTTIGLGTLVQANPLSIVGYYKSSGYTVDLNSNGEYHSCNAQNLCLTIPQSQSSQQGKIWIWKNSGSTYRVIPLREVSGRAIEISVQVVNPENTVIFDRVFTPQ